ncbi:hypothetical protein G6011_03733 [Alternaria panax]|uniref:Uncharacterized protein n=1 Tax=Alternaria panax TaxID=48097 RepID=A0AAD4IF94_9PLEO|nr:hypothetical protein G6011_03733 [Alternaria panax]
MLPTADMRLLRRNIALFLPRQRRPWRPFNEVVGSNGPQYQLQLKPQDVSQWASDEKDVLSSKWFLRINDGSICPKDLLILEEVEYQTWLSERYPEFDAVKARGLYLNADYLSRSEEQDMLINKYFHISHCVHSMRRYWVAKQTGHHICPMDLSHWHINYCFENILLPWALSSGPRGTVPTGFDDATLQDVSWVPRVCF